MNAALKRRRAQQAPVTDKQARDMFCEHAKRCCWAWNPLLGTDARIELRIPGDPRQGPPRYNCAIVTVRNARVHLEWAEPLYAAGVRSIVLNVNKLLRRLDREIESR